MSERTGMCGQVLHNQLSFGSDQLHCWAMHGSPNRQHELWFLRLPMSQRSDVQLRRLQHELSGQSQKLLEPVRQYCDGQFQLRWLREAVPERIYLPIEHVRYKLPGKLDKLQRILR